MTIQTFLAVGPLVLLLAACGRDQQPAPAADRHDNAKAAAPAKGDAHGDEAEEHHDEGEATSVELTAETQKQLGIVVAPAAESELAVPLQASGTVQATDARLSHVRPLARGRIVEVKVKTGDRVTSGQTLATFDNIEAGELASQHQAARAELARLRVQLSTATRQAERARKLLDLGAIPQKEFEASLSEQQQLEEAARAQESTVAGLGTRLRRFGVPDTSTAASPLTTIRAPFAGVVTRVEAGPGEVVDSSTELFTVANLSEVYVLAQVYEKDLGRIRAGQTATIMVDAYPDERFTGRIVTIADTIDPQTRTVAVRCAVPNPKGLLKLDMFATVQLPTTASAKALTVPTDAVQSLEGKTVVFVREGDTTFHVRPIEAGQSTATLTAIARGLKAGELVVTRGAFQVKSALQAAELGEEGHHD